MNMKYLPMKHLRACYLSSLVILVTPCAVAANPVATLSEVHGITTLQSPGSSSRFVTVGETIQRGDIVSTSARGFVTIAASDGSQISLRPSTSFVFQDFDTEVGKESAVMRLLRGGMSAQTGSLSKRNADAVKVISPTATINVRSGDFDVRVCGKDDCVADSGSSPSAAATAKRQASEVTGRVAFLQGKVRANNSGQERDLSSGAPIHVGDKINTGVDSNVVVVFSDRGRVTIQADSEFLIQSYAFFEGFPERNLAVLKLLHGGARIFTGQIGKLTPDKFEITTPVASVHVRGTGVDVSCVGACASPSSSTGTSSPSPGGTPNPSAGLYTYVWQGGVVLNPLPSGGSTPAPSTLINESQTGFYSPGQQNVNLLAQPPSFFTQSTAPRPDTVSVNHDTMFGTQAGGNAPGTYAFVRNGHLSVQGNTGPTIDLGSNETAFVQTGGSQGAQRLGNVPAFIANDPTPRPTRPLPPPPPSSSRAATSTVATPPAGPAADTSNQQELTNPLISPFNPGSSAGCQVPG